MKVPFARLHLLLIFPLPSQLYGLYRAAKDGEAPPEDPTMDQQSKQYKQHKAWRDCGILLPSEAQTSFIVTLYTVCPDWDYTSS